MKTRTAFPKLAKPCYSHVGGTLGRLLMEQFIAKGWIGKRKSSDRHFIITLKGEKEFAKLGVDLFRIK